MNDKIYRIIDANLNRSREGLRVCEEIVRFALDDAKLTAELKALRHKITDAIRFSSIDTKDLLASRESELDVGKELGLNEDNTTNSRRLRDIFMANLERTKEALRALEEFTQAIDKAASEKFRSMRFETYTLEKKVVGRLSTIRDS